jgi:hypothetical protein
MYHPWFPYPTEEIKGLLSPDERKTGSPERGRLRQVGIMMMLELVMLLLLMIW